MEKCGKTKKKKKKENEKMLIAKKKKKKKANKKACKGKESLFKVDVIYGYRPVMYRTLCQ